MFNNEKATKILWALISIDCHIKNKLNETTIPTTINFFPLLRYSVKNIVSGMVITPKIKDKILPLSSMYPKTLKKNFKINRYKGG